MNLSFRASSNKNTKKQQILKTLVIGFFCVFSFSVQAALDIGSAVGQAQGAIQAGQGYAQQGQAAIGQAQSAISSVKNINASNALGTVQKFTGTSFNIQSLTNNKTVQQFKGLASQIKSGQQTFDQMRAQFGDFQGMSRQILGQLGADEDTLKALLNKVKSDNEPKEIIDEVLAAITEQADMKNEFLKMFQEEQKKLVSTLQLADLEGILAQEEAFQKLIEEVNEQTAQSQERMQQSISTLGQQGSEGYNPADLAIGNEGNLNLDPVSNDDSNLINRLLRYLTMSVGTFAVFMMIVGGYFMVTSQGDDNRLQKGKNIFLYTIIGILVAFSSYALVQFILSVLFKN